MNNRPLQDQRSRALPPVPGSPTASIVDRVQTLGAQAPRQQSPPSTSGAFAADPGDLVSRALAILAEKNNESNAAQTGVLPLQRRIGGEKTQRPDLPLQRRVLSDGTVVPLPVRYFDAQCLLASFLADVDRAAGLLKGTGLQAMTQEDGKAVVVLGCFEYRKTDIGPYNEFCLAVSATVAGDPVPALYVANLPVTTAAAELAGREIWGFNKFVTSIDVKRDGKKFSTSLCDPSGAKLLTLQGARGASLPLPPADVLTFSLLAGKIVKTVVRVVTPFQLSSGENFVLRLGESQHPVANNLQALALDGAHPALVQYSDQFQSLLFPGQVVQIRAA